MTNSEPTRNVQVRRQANPTIARPVNLGMVLLLLIPALAACTSGAGAASSAPTTEPTPEPSPTPLPPQPDTALEAAIARFDSYQSYTLNSTVIYENSSNDTTYTTLTTQYVDVADQTTLIESASETLPTSNYQKLCVGEQCYKSDATGLFKPNNGHYYPPKPALSLLGLDVDHVLDNEYTYIGEEMKDGRNTFKYQMEASQAQMTDPELSLAQPAPVVHFYVDALSGDLLAYDGEFYKTINSTQGHYQVSYTYSNWNASTFTIPEVVAADNTEWQTYNGEFSSAVTFEFPKVDYLDESFGYPSLTAPSGSRMYFQLFATIATLTMVDESEDVNKSLMCEMVFNEFILAYDTTGATLERAEWLEGPYYPFCKGIINTANGQEARYLFNEPNELAVNSGRLLPQTFYITVIPAEGEDVDSTFWDVIQTIQLGPNAQ
jgi:hypothetical protein